MKEDFSHIEHLKLHLKSFLVAIHFNDIQALVKNAAILILSFLAPIKSAIFAVYFLILVDLITGITASIKEKRAITSSGLSRTVGKILIYSTTIVVSFIVHKYLLVGFELPIETLVSGFIAITETKSIFENLNRISPNTVISDLIILLSNERNKRMPVDKKKEFNDE